MRINMKTRKQRIKSTKVEALESRRLLAAVAWDGGAGDGLWHSATNWSNDQVPDLTDDVTIDGPGTYTVTVSMPAAANSLVLGSAPAAGGTQTLEINYSLALASASIVNPSGTLRLNPSGVLSGAGDLDIFGHADWFGGAMSGVGETVNRGTMRVSGHATKLLQRGITNEYPATIDWTGGGDLVFGGGGIENFGGTINISGNGAIRSAGGGSIVSVSPINQTGTTVIDVPFYAHGLITTAVTHVGGTLTLTGGGLSRGVFDVSGTLVFTGATYEILGVGRTDGTGTLRFESGTHHLLTSNVITAGRMEVANAGTNVETYAFELNELSVRDGALLRATRGPGRTKSLSIDSTSRLDMATTLVVDYASGGPSPLGAIRAMLTSGYAGGAWSGSGIGLDTSDPARAVGYAEAAALFTQFPATFSYYQDQLDDTTVILHATRYGDANLDGDVDLEDFNRLAGNFGTGTLWSQGDFNFDGAVGLFDFNRLAGQFGQSAPGASADPAEPDDGDDEHEWAYARSPG
jgi:hypothetical protein